MDSILSLKDVMEDNWEVEYDVLPSEDSQNLSDDRRKIINSELYDVDTQLEATQKKVNEINKEIDKLTCHADGVDYTVAVACGILTGAIDVFLLGEFDFIGSKEVVNERIDEFVKSKATQMRKSDALENAVKKAKEKGVDEEKINEIKKNIENDLINKPMDKTKAVKFFEDKYSIPSDNVWNTKGSTISSKSHHLDDVAHHPTIIGLTASILTQFTSDAYFQDKSGTNMLIKAQTTKVIKKGKESIEIKLIGTDIKTKIFCGVINWLGHLLSDIAGSSSSARKGNVGMGLPGPIISTLKELSMLPVLKNTSLPQVLNDLFTKDDALFGEFRLDMRSELAIGVELGKQAIPVFINTIFTRSFYFIRRFIFEASKAKSIKNINWSNVFPWKNRTINRMLTISLGTFETIDLADAAIHGAVDSGGTVPGFFASFVLRVNFVGIGRFAIAVGSDVSMGIKRNTKIKEREELYTEQRKLLGAKSYLKVADTWCDISDIYAKEEGMYNSQAKLWNETIQTQKAMDELYACAINSIKLYSDSIKTTYIQLTHIVNALPEAEKLNPGITDILLGGTINERKQK